MGTLLKTIFFVFACVGSFNAPSEGQMMRAENHPIIGAPATDALAPGQSTTVTITMSETASSATVLNMSYVGVTGPSTATVASGQSTVVVTVSLPANYNGSVASASATTNGSTLVIPIGLLTQ